MRKCMPHVFGWTTIASKMQEVWPSAQLGADANLAVSKASMASVEGHRETLQL